MGGQSRPGQRTRLTWLLLAGVLLLLLAVLGLTTHQRLQRTQELLTQSLSQHGGLTVQYLEAATRAGLRHGLWRVWMPQALVDELVDQLQVRSLAVLGPRGELLLSATAPGEQNEALDPLAGLDEAQRQAVSHRRPLNALVGQDLVVGRPFEPFRRFQRLNLTRRPGPSPLEGEPGRPPETLAPGPPPPPPGAPPEEAPPWPRMGPGMGMMMGQGRMGGQNPGQAPPELRGYALVRLSTAGLEEAREQDVRQALLLAGLLFLAAGAVSLAVWAAARKRGRELERLRKEVADSEHLAAVGRLAGSVAHEVRNPLSALRGLVQFLAKDREPGSRQAEYAQVAVAEVDRLERVVSGLLEYTRPRPPRRFPLDLEESLRSTLELMGDDPRAQGVEMRLDLATPLPTVSADPDQVRQVLVNLVVNALEAMNGRGSLVLSAKPGPGGMLVGVADEGPGLPPGDPEQLFDPFFSTRDRGSGLGLAIARRIVQAHGGRLTAANRPQGGALFSFNLPLAGGKT